MHYHCEIIMPPTENVEQAVQQIMGPFGENGEDASSSAFWDFWVIGGRWAGAKMLAAVGEERIAAFHKELHAKNVTVSGFQAGKMSLDPGSQREMVDALWSERFPEHAGIPCPLFAHSNDQYNSSSLLPDDVASLAATPEAMKCSRVIVAGPGYSGGVCAAYMVEDEYWNGVTHVKTAWNGTIAEALSMAAEKFQHYKDEWRVVHTPTPDWLCVTLDYHS